MKYEHEFSVSIFFYPLSVNFFLPSLYNTRIITVCTGIGEMRNYWVGLKKESNGWKWGNGRGHTSVLGGGYWDVIEPNNVGVVCARIEVSAVAVGRLADNYCSVEYYAVCEEKTN